MHRHQRGWTDGLRHHLGDAGRLRIWPGDARRGAALQDASNHARRPAGGGRYGHHSAEMAARPGPAVRAGPPRRSPSPLARPSGGRSQTTRQPCRGHRRRLRRKRGPAGGRQRGPARQGRPVRRLGGRLRQTVRLHPPGLGERPDGGASGLFLPVARRRRDHGDGARLQMRAEGEPRPDPGGPGLADAAGARCAVSAVQWRGWTASRC